MRNLLEKRKYRTPLEARVNRGMEDEYGIKQRDSREVSAKEWSMLCDQCAWFDDVKVQGIVRKKVGVLVEEYMGDDYDECWVDFAEDKVKLNIKIHTAYPGDKIPDGLGDAMMDAFRRTAKDIHCRLDMQSHTELEFTFDFNENADLNDLASDYLYGNSRVGCANGIVENVFGPAVYAIAKVVAKFSGQLNNPKYGKVAD